MKTALRFHLLVILLGLVTPLVFLQAPGLGDDLTYWQLAFEVHEKGLAALDPTSFHDLRWPVWGLSWLLQGMGGHGLAGYYGVPMIYGALGAWLVFLFGRLAFQDVRPAILGAVLFLFHPLLDSIVYRPMPDLSEGVLGAIAMWCWYALMTARKRRILLAIATGSIVAVMYSNRLTGLFIVPVLIVCTLVFFPRRFPWLILAGTAAAGVFALEGLLYWKLHGDFLHSLHANLGARGRKGTESVALWILPFRFFDSLWKGSPLAPFYVLSAAAGGVKLWRSGGQAGRVIVVWFATIYLSYSCALQGIHPVRPLLRDADRFLVGCIAPMCILSAAGWVWLWQLLAGWAPGRRVAGLLERHPAWSLAAGLLLLIPLSGRAVLDSGYIPQYRRYVNAVPAGTKVFTHHSMRALTFLLAPRRAAGIEWTTKHYIVERKASLERIAEATDQIWFSRKLAWLGIRKRLEQAHAKAGVEYTSYIEAPENNWRLMEVVTRDENPDFVFWARRPANAPVPEWRPLRDFLPALALPLSWKKNDDPHPLVSASVPPALRGHRIYLRVEAFSDMVEASAPYVEFRRGERLLVRYLLKPYLARRPGRDYFALEIPAAADAAVIDFDMNRKTRTAQLDAIDLLVFP